MMLIKHFQVFLFENVRGLLNHDRGRTWQIIHDIFEELADNTETEEETETKSKK